MVDIKVFGVVGVDLDAALSTLDQNIILARTLIGELVLLWLVAISPVKEYTMPHADRGTELAIAQVFNLGMGIGKVLCSLAPRHEAPRELAVILEFRVYNNPVIGHSYSFDISGAR
ncbi:hypothetical protein ES708_16627 [subsurface metagenome]